MKGRFEVELRALGDNFREVEQFLRSELHGTVVRRGTRLIVEGNKPRDVKLKLEKFLFHHGLHAYRVSAKEGSLEVLATGKPSKSRNVPFQASTSETTPEYFPGLSAFAATRFKTPHYYFGPERIPTIRRGKKANSARKC